jgi:hypothetical protein
MWVAHKVQCEWRTSCNVGWRPPRMWVETNPYVVGDHAHVFVYYFINHMALDSLIFFSKYFIVTETPKISSPYSRVLLIPLAFPAQIVTKPIIPVYVLLKILVFPLFYWSILVEIVPFVLLTCFLAGKRENLAPFTLKSYFFLCEADKLLKHC